MAKQTIADYLAKTLAAADIERIWGVTGDSLNGLSDSLQRLGSIRWMPTRHEEVAAFAAGADAAATGKLAVCAGSCGPGNLHLINGLYDCHRNHQPVLAIASHIPSSEIGLGYFQETHPELIFRECSHYCEMITNPRQVLRVLQTAMQHAVSRRGVSVVVIPGDVAALKATGDVTNHKITTGVPVVRPADSDLVRLAEILNQSPAVTLFCGIGCAGAHDELMILAE